MASAETPISTSSGDDSRLKRRNLIFAILSLCVAASMPITALVGSQVAFARVSDFPEFFSAAKMVCNGKAADIYILKDLFGCQQQIFPALGERGIGFYIPPFACPMLAPLGLLDSRLAFGIYVFLSIFSVIGGLIFLTKFFKLDKTGMFWLATLLCATAPLFEALRISQLAPFLFLSFSASLFFLRNEEDFFSGLSLSILLLKPQELLPVAIFLLCARKYKIIGTVVGIFLILAAISFLIFGEAGYSNYFSLLRDSAANTQFMKPEISATIRGQLLRIDGVGNNSTNLISSAFLALSSISIAWAGFKARGLKTKQVEILLAWALPLGLLSSFHCHDYDLMLLAPWLTLCFLKNDSRTSTKLLQIATLLFLMILAVPFYAPIHYKWLLEQNQTLNPVFIFFALTTGVSIWNCNTELKQP